METKYVVVNLQCCEEENICGIYDTKEEAEDIAHLCNILCNASYYTVHVSPQQD